MIDEPLLPKIEEKILRFWEDRDIFQKTLQNRIDGKRFVFFEGPPTANNHPAMHHLIGRVFKDIFVRYKTMRGYYVPRKAGWDTHGLPVELEVEKELRLKNKKEIEEYGVARFNTKAKESVWKYIEEWQEFTKRIGFWLDMKHPYITYNSSYMESLWWIIKEIDKRGLLYEGHKVLPWCTRCGTALSSHEVAQGYEDVTDTALYVKFKLQPGQKINKEPLPENTFILAWTTTPWTLPGNVALAVGKNIKYQVVRVEDKNESYILAEGLTDKLPTTNYQLLATVSGKDLVGLKYEPLFDVSTLQSEKSYQIYPADFVTTTDGTGVVHTAVMYGEDDYELGKKLGLPAIHTVDELGKFNKSVPDLEGQYVKSSQAEKTILEYLESGGLLFKTEPYTHSYPHCWRCHTPLLYYAKNSWFVGMSKLRKQLVKNNRRVNWIPEHLRDGRFGEFIKEAKDWAFSRERYWGTPLPVWRCEQCQSQRVAGSLGDLEEHRHKKPNTFILLRHGHSEKNGTTPGEELIASKLDSDKYNLVSDGIRQVEEKAEFLKQQDGVDMIVASPFLRTQQSAKIMSDKLGVKILTDERLKELDHGFACEGKSYQLCSSADIHRDMDNKKHEDGESWRQTRKRMFEVARELNDKHEGKKILIVSHGDPMWLLETALLGLDDQKTIDLKTEHYLKQGEIQEVTFKNWPYDENGDVNMHRPYVDEITLKCEKCQGRMNRVKDVVDVWFDSGAMPFAQWHYPFDDVQDKASKKDFEQNFPADFISEAIDQTRGWFYTLLAISTLLGKGPPYKNVVCYSHLVDAQGRKMSKSLGNIIEPMKAINEYGVDVIRWWFYTVNNVGDVKSMSLPTSLKQPKAFVGTLLNSLNFFELYNKPTGKQVKLKAKPQRVLDYWLLSRLHTLIREISKSLDEYDPTSSSRMIESFVVDDLSNWWIRRSRELFQRPENKKSFNQAVQFLQYILIEVSKLTAPYMPFVSEHVYKKLGSIKESVHLEDWPKAKKKFINENLEKQMLQVREAIALGLAQRKNSNLKVRQPLASIALKRVEKFDSELEELIKAELNVKEIVYNSTLSNEADLDTHLTHELILEGYIRELIRQIQDMRKESKYKIDDKVFLSWESDHPDLISAIGKFEDEIKKTTLLKEFSKGHQPNLAFDIEKEFDLAPGIKIWLGIRK